MTGRFRQGFTLIELLMVVAIMGLMGTLSVGGYRSMRRGMEERAVLRNASQFIRNAYQRAQIDRQPTAVFFWNEVRRDESDDGAESMQVVGRAVAVRLAGRVTAVDGSCLLDEFGDLSFSSASTVNDEGDREYDEDVATEGATSYIYKMTGGGSWDQSKYLAAQATVKRDRIGTLKPMLGGGGDPTQSGNFVVYGYYLKSGAGDWSAGTPYGFEIADLTLPNNYIFGDSLNVTKISDGPKDTGKAIWFYPAGMTGSGGGARTITISAVRPGSSGSLEAQALSEATEDPSH